MSAPSKVRPLHVLLATDLAPSSRPHTQFAIGFADRLGARTTLFHAAIGRAMVIEPVLAAVPVPPAENLAASRKTLQSLAASCPTSRPVHVAVDAAADARAAILDAAERVEADLLILPSHGRTGVQRALLGSTAEQVLRRSKWPVMLLTDRMMAEKHRSDRATRTIVVATDLSPTAAAAHHPAADLARRLGMSLLLVSVLPAREPPPMGGGAPAKPQPSDPHERTLARVKQLREAAVAVGEGLHVEVLAHLADDPATAIVDLAAAQDAAFVVMATHARRGLARTLLGSVAEGVVRRSTVPVVCIPVHGD